MKFSLAYSDAAENSDSQINVRFTLSLSLPGLRLLHGSALTRTVKKGGTWVS